MFKLKKIVVLLLVLISVSIETNASTVIVNNSIVTSSEKSAWSVWGDNLAARVKVFISNDTAINNKDFTYSFSVNKQGNVVFQSVVSSDLKNLKIITANMKSIITVLNKNAVVKFPQNTNQIIVTVKGTYRGKVKRDTEPLNTLVVELSKVSAAKISSNEVKTTVSSQKNVQPKKTVNQVMIDGELVNVQTIDIGEETVSSLVWNQWRADVTNAFLKSYAKYPFGKNKEAERVKYSFDIDNKGNFSNIYVTPYDNSGQQCSESTRFVILNSVKLALVKMQHSLTLRFPEGSKRSKVTVSGTYVPINRGRYANASDYNDVETVRTVN